MAVAVCQRPPWVPLACCVTTKEEAGVATFKASPHAPLGCGFPFCRFHNCNNNINGKKVVKMNNVEVCIYIKWPLHIRVIILGSFIHLKTKETQNKMVRLFTFPPQNDNNIFFRETYIFLK